MNLAKKIIIFILLSFCFQTAAQAGWIKQNSGTFAWLHSVYFISENKGWIVGSQGTFLATSDGGKTWKQSARFTQDAIRDVHFSDERTGWILCERNIFSSGEAASSYLMKTTDGGANWQRIEFAEAGRERLARMFFTRDGYGYAVGESGAFFAMQDDKKTWKKSILPSRYLLLDGVFTDELHGAIVGGGRTILFTEDAGLTWNRATILGQSQAESKLNSIFFVNPRNGWTVGSNGRIFTTATGGKLWREQASNINKDLLDVFFVSASEGWAVGDQGAILHTMNAGNTWETIDSGIAGISNKHKLEKILFVGKRGFIVGFGGTILVYDANAQNNLSRKPPQILRREIKN